MKEPRYAVVEKACCGTCVHYHQHYILEAQGKVCPIWYGHCSNQRIKRRTPGETCPDWQARAKGKDES